MHAAGLTLSTPVVPEGRLELLLLCIVLSWLLVLGLLFSGGGWPAAAPTGQTGMPDASTTEDHRLIPRLRNHRLLMTYLFWKAASRGDRPPRLCDIRWQCEPVNPHMFTVAIENPGEKTPRFRYLEVGSALQERLGRRFVGLRTSDVNPQQDNEHIGSLEGAYRRCVRTMMPSYEYANFDFGDDSPVTFERLILPLTGTNGHVTHLIGVVLFSEQESRRHGTEQS